MGYTSNLSFVRKNPITTAVATITLAAGVIYTLVAGANNNDYVLQGKTQDGRLTSYVTGSGSARFSGAVLVRSTITAKSTLSGASLVGGVPATGGGKAMCWGTGGTLSYCQSAVIAGGTCSCK